MPIGDLSNIAVAQIYDVGRVQTGFQLWVLFNAADIFAGFYDGVWHPKEVKFTPTGDYVLQYLSSVQKFESIADAEGESHKIRWDENLINICFNAYNFNPLADRAIQSAFLPRMSAELANLPANGPDGPINFVNIFW